MSTDTVVIIISLFLIYILIGLFSMLIAECVSQIFQFRSTTLWGGVDVLLDDPALRAAFYDHGLIVTARSAKGRHRPGYLCEQTFALALLGCLGAGKDGVKIADLEANVRKLPQSRIRDVLLSHFFAAGGETTRLLTLLSQWYGQAIAVLGCGYVARVRLIALAIAAFLTIAANVDSIAVAKAVWADRMLKAHLTQGMTGGVSHVIPPFETGRARAVSASLTLLKQINEQIRPMPFGWHAASPDLRVSDDWFWYWFSKMIGLGFTIVLASFAAVAWFDLLAKPLNLRNDRRGSFSDDPGLR